ncbi:helix-turn-helix domain-containing protein [Merismopedia glauca]|uniref:XRE family transcriptional regulator n=1 Tax=Merismopedia glauca CCAP 1448/3 TaxID=1296344 RepID=A0A2T1C9J4_9CYAN|nr:helix-turn-helix domain-containing protein [Merismopedia glauca]PSB04926.1 XRE family transcriptional regulator [Merismopedia glauca CCAP 1448/3]
MRSHPNNNTDNFGQTIRQTRQQKNYSQKELAKLIGVNYTYLSKLENNSADYPPSQKVIDLLASHLSLDPEKLRQLAGRINSEEEAIFQELLFKYEQMPAFLRRMKSDPAFAKKVISYITEE